MPSASIASPAYDLIAIDLDGTLLCDHGHVSPANLKAIHDARRHGVRVTVCTGRGMIECRHITDILGQTEPVIVAGGAILACPQTLSTLHRFPMQQTLVGELVDCMLAHGHAALVLKDPSATGHSIAAHTAIENPISPTPAAPLTSPRRGHDYLVVSPNGLSGIDPVTRWWFDKLNIPVRIVPRLEDDEHPDSTVRVGVCGTRRSTRAVAADIRATFAERTTLHHFNAVIPGTNPATEDDHILILEAFGKDVNKWTAIAWLAGRDGINPGRIAAIGNDINDVAMLKAAGLGVAMANAIPEAKSAASRHTLRNDEHGVAHAIDQILRGHW
jgi:hydroxymethylpyrimidine pyrophosphatase-like HAD family hydrolase